jgi:tRNA pseudouridine13 synthase
MRSKEIPSDFIVEEILPEGLAGLQDGPFFLLSFKKTGRNTEDVVQDAARALRIPRRALNICGNKDRQAVTTQFLSINRQHLQGMKQETLLDKLSRIKDATFTVVGFLDTPLSLGSLAGNTFTITVRDLDSAQQKVADAFGRQKTLPCIPNYFDEQRFSKSNLAVGRAFVKKDFSGAWRILSPLETTNPIGELRKLPQKTLLLFVHAYQSWLWNETVALFLEGKGGRDVPYSCGIFRFPKTTVKNIPIPLIGFGTDLNAITPPSLRNIVKRILEKECVTQMDFVIRQVPEITSEGGTRSLLMEVKDFSIAFEEDDLFPEKKKAIVRFALPPGSYATMVVKALFPKHRHVLC